jgi:divalent metal cation (Fe/Co/Zn/Cd) transporter
MITMIKMIKLLYTSDDKGSFLLYWFISIYVCFDDYDNDHNYEGGRIMTLMMMIVVMIIIMIMTESLNYCFDWTVFLTSIG